jgi:hypothetical protein
MQVLSQKCHRPEHGPEPLDTLSDQNVVLYFDLARLRSDRTARYPVRSRAPLVSGSIRAAAIATI